MSLPRPGLKKMQIGDNAPFKSIFTPELHRLREIFDAHGYEIRIAGGAVRDLLMDIKPADYDFATTATPAEMKAAFEAEGIRMLHKKGEEHGTITCRINDCENFEVTTLRIDVVCDGRRAEIKYTTDWEVDAFRRDLTINSLFLGLDGTVFDYTDGIDDVRTRRVRFVGDAVDRICEDYLRILRYFRFFGRIAPIDSEHDAVTLRAIIDHRSGMADLSGERIWSELKRIVVGRLAGDVVKTMLDVCGLHEYIGVPTSASTAEFCRLHQQASERKASLQPCTALAALFAGEEDVALFHKKCKISNNEKFLAFFIVQHRDAAARNTGDIFWFQKLLTDEQYIHGRNDQEANRSRVIELLKYVNAYDAADDLARWEIPKMPVNGITLLEADVPKGKHMKAVLSHLYLLWRDSAYTLTMDELLLHRNEIEATPALEPQSKKKRVC